MVTKKKKQTALDKAMDDLSQKVRQALGAMIIDSPTAFIAPADVAERVASNYSLSGDEVEILGQRVGGVLSQMYKQGKCNIFRTEHKITPMAVNKKAQYGYRIGPALTPLRTTAVRLEEKLTAEAAAAAVNDPVAFLLSIKGQLPIIKINSLIVELVNELQSRVMEQHVQMVELDRRIKTLHEDFRSLNPIPTTQGE